MTVYVLTIVYACVWYVASWCMIFRTSVYGCLWFVVWLCTNFTRFCVSGYDLLYKFGRFSSDVECLCMSCCMIIKMFIWFCMVCMLCCRMFYVVHNCCVWLCINGGMILYGIFNCSWMMCVWLVVRFCMLIWYCMIVGDLLLAFVICSYDCVWCEWFVLWFCMCFVRFGKIVYDFVVWLYIVIYYVCMIRYDLLSDCVSFSTNCGWLCMLCCMSV